MGGCALTGDVSLGDLEVGGADAGSKHPHQSLAGLGDGQGLLDQFNPLRGLKPKGAHCVWECGGHDDPDNFWISNRYQ
eukprot:scaffold174364_cov36-Prasinocladus_malaysianus.AAC.2